MQSMTIVTALFKVGDRVRFQLGGRKVLGTVVEDRGLIGVDGRQLVRVQVELDPTYVQQFELPAALLERASRTARAS
jgi:hypothetical protein